ncbi:cyclase [Agromyces badenianii]|uniref:Cyclase n=1 Tax=Agromyces badenianii TaxID=2080742 RepID=A0A2S0WUS7_9MICO|nr:cyclase [Agromyces badenianii]
MSTTVTASTEVGVPVRVAYDQWTQFESFPEFLSGVVEIRQIDDVMTHWVVSIGGVKREFDAEIGDQVPDGHVSWSSVGEVVHRGRVRFTPVSAERTRIDLEIEWEPEGFVEAAGATLQLDDMQVKRDLARFKDFIEEHHRATGGWRGEIHGGDTTDTGGVGSGARASEPGAFEAPASDTGVLGTDPDLRP